MGLDHPACRGKHAHATKEAAMGQARRLKRAGYAGDRLDAYRCPGCGLWHVGTELKYARPRGRRKDDDR